MIIFDVNFYDILNERVDVYFHKRDKTYHDFVPLSNYVVVKGGKRIPKGKEFSEKETNFLYLRLSDITDFEKIDYKKLKCIDNNVYQTLKRYEIAENDLAISIAGTIGRIILLKNVPSEKKIILTENCALLVLKDKAILPDYLKIVLDLPLVQEQISRNRIQTTIPKIGLDRISKLQIPKVPSIEIQQQIVNLYNYAVAEKQNKEQEAQTLLAGIDNYLLKELGIELPENVGNERYFEISIEELIRGRLDVFYYRMEFRTLFESINNKSKTKLRDYITSINYGASVSNAYVEKGIPFLRIKDLLPNDIQKGEIVFLPNEMQEQLQTSLVHTNDFLISRSGTIGVTAIVNSEFDGFAFGSFMIRFATQNINRQFLSYYINSTIGQYYFGRNRIGAIQGNITIPTIKDLPIPDITIEKQNEIAEHIQSIRATARRLQEEAKEGLKMVKSEIEKMIK